MKAISFAWTTPALLAGQKTMTSRFWKTDEYAQTFKIGEPIYALDTQYWLGGKPLAVIRLQEPLYQLVPPGPWEGSAVAKTALLLPSDWQDEGFEYMSVNRWLLDGLEPIRLWESWQANVPDRHVIRFTVEELTDWGKTCLEAIWAFDKKYDHAVRPWTMWGYVGQPVA